MAVAAVPHYLGSDFSSASPEMRFGMYLKLWGVDRRSDKRIWRTYDLSEEQGRRIQIQNKTNAINAAAHLRQGDRYAMSALSRRQEHLIQHFPCDQVLSVRSISTAPFTTGLGNEHALENGFAFLSPYGLPYLAGSGVKGVVRRAAQELASTEWGPSDWHTYQECAVLTPMAESLHLSITDILFGREPPDGDRRHFRGALSFWDVIPKVAGQSLAVDIMTPHQTHYYQRTNGQRQETPHDSGTPNPITFLTVPPRSHFTFHLTCDLDRLRRFAPKLAKNDLWKQLLRAALGHAFDWLGFGAKTSVGYGALAAARQPGEPSRRQAQRDAVPRSGEPTPRHEPRQGQRNAAHQRDDANRRRAKRDALPESRKRMLDAEEALERWERSSVHDQRSRHELNSAIKRLTEQALRWDSDERIATAALLERIYNKIGWHQGGKPKQRERQERKRRDVIAKIRTAGDQ